ncbi:hypothetical protein ABEB36_001771 [Hypothenemus hampei]|uniref:Ion transport domain-containing protein n=1 Tax=Hypothenemus hampei TaxID=57062 RepID=A0ABD1FIU9_HYPHA
MSDNEQLVELITQPDSPSTDKTSISSVNLLDHLVNNPDSLNLSSIPDEDFKCHQPQNILTQACQNPLIPVKGFKKLFEHAMTRWQLQDFAEDCWYYWVPLHFAAFYVDIEKLHVMMDTLDEQMLNNALTMFSENALHVLLEYGRGDSFNVQLSNGWESRVYHVVGKEKPRIVQCARLLIQGGIDVNHNNIWNETPLMIAIKYRLLEVVRLLVLRQDIDLDTCKNEQGKSARDLLSENNICQDIVRLDTFASPSPSKTLFTFLKGKDEALFLRYNNENIKQYVNETDKSCTMLQLCLIKGFTDFNGNIFHEKEDPLKAPLLKHFCSNGFGRSIDHLLSNEADIFIKSNVFGHLNVFQMAVKLGYFPFVAMLLEHRHSKIAPHHIFQALGTVTTKNFHTLKHVILLLTTKLEMYQAIHCFNGNRTVLDNLLDVYVTFNGTNDKYKSNICQILRLGASLTGELKGNQGEKKLKEISRETLKAHLDECVNRDNSVCYDTLIKDNEFGYSETELLHELSHDTKKKELLNHPALIYLVHVKWLKCKKFFYFNLFVYSFFIIFLALYMIGLQMRQNHVLIKLVFLSLLLIQILKEMVQLFLFFPRYFFNLSNYLEVLALSCCCVNIFRKNEETMVIAILLSSSSYLMMLGQLPQFTKYMIIFSSTKYFLEYAAFYFIQFASFSLCFFILLPPSPHEASSLLEVLGAILVKLFEALLFFIGQYDGDITTIPQFPIFGRIVVAMFIFCMTIILNNLLVGLIVTDMDVIQKNGKLQRQIKMIRYIKRIELFLAQGDKFYCLKWIKKGFDTEFFEPGQRKMVQDIQEFAEVLEEEDRIQLKMIYESRTAPKNVLSNLYEHINKEIYGDQKKVKENRDILVKLAKLEEHLNNKARMRR